VRGPATANAQQLLVQWLVEGSRKQHASAEWCVTYGTQQWHTTCFSLHTEFSTFSNHIMTHWLRVNRELTRHWENITGSVQETTDLLQYILLGNSGNDRLLTGFLHFAANYEFIENVMCFFKVEYNVEFTNLKQIKNINSTSFKTS